MNTKKYYAQEANEWLRLKEATYHFDKQVSTKIPH